MQKNHVFYASHRRGRWWCSRLERRWFQTETSTTAWDGETLSPTPRTLEPRQALHINTSNVSYHLRQSDSDNGDSKALLLRSTSPIVKFQNDRGKARDKLLRSTVTK